MGLCERCERRLNELLITNWIMFDAKCNNLLMLMMMEKSQTFLSQIEARTISPCSTSFPSFHPRREYDELDFFFFFDRIWKMQ